jgi:hypothetical protein
VGDVEATELRLVKIEGGDSRLLLAGASRFGPDGVPIAFFKSPQFSPDGTRSSS